MATATQSSSYATYKGKTYLLLWSGSTKYGRRAKLGFRDGTKEFWVDEDQVSKTSAPSSTSSYSSGRRGLIDGDLYTARNGEEKVFGCSACTQGHGMCSQCRHDEYDC